MSHRLRRHFGATSAEDDRRTSPTLWHCTGPLLVGLPCSRPADEQGWHWLCTSAPAGTVRFGKGTLHMGARRRRPSATTQRHTKIKVRVVPLEGRSGGNRGSHCSTTNWHSATGDCSQHAALPLRRNVLSLSLSFKPHISQALVLWALAFTVGDMVKNDRL